MLLCKSLYSLWGNFCYPLSVFFTLRIKPQFYCQKPDKHWTFGHRKSDLKDYSSRSLKDIKIYTLQDNGCYAITCEIIPTRSIRSFTKLFCLVIISLLYRYSNCFLLSFCNSKFTVSKQYHHLPYRLYCIIGAYRSQHFKVIKLSFISV